MEKINTNNESPERIKLLALESEGRWVFHGSSSKIKIFKPKQAYRYPKNSDEGRVADGDPAVFSSPFVDIAIFMGIINKTNAPRGLRSGFGTDSEGKIKFQATKETIDQLHKATGYVYVFDKTKFIPRSSVESLSYEPVTPDDVVMVTERDLPKNIEIKDF